MGCECHFVDSLLSVDEQGLTPILLAATSGHHQIVRYLRQVRPDAWDVNTPVARRVRRAARSSDDETDLCPIPDSDTVYSIDRETMDGDLIHGDESVFAEFDGHMYGA